MSRESTESETDSHDASTDRSTAPRYDGIDYLSQEVDLLKPNTPFVRDHLKVIWAGSIMWVLPTFGPPVPIYFAPVTMTVQLLVISFPLHYFLVTVLPPTSLSVLAFIYSRKRDQLDEWYDIDHTASQTRSKSESEATVADEGRVG